MNRVLEAWPCGCRIEEPDDKARYAERLVMCPEHARTVVVAQRKWREVVYPAPDPLETV